MTKLVANNVSKKFKSHQVLQGLSFNCEDEILFIAGKNGAGKTTFIRLALGMERLDKGEIHYEGDKELSTSELRKGCVFDTPCLFMEMSGHKQSTYFVLETYRITHISIKFLIVSILIIGFSCKKQKHTRLVSNID